MDSLHAELLAALKTLVTEIDVIEFSEDTAISEEAYSKAVDLIREYENKQKETVVAPAGPVK
jgi:hypothetical protein